MDIATSKCGLCGHEEEYFSHIDVWDKEKKEWRKLRRPLYKYCEECGSTDLKEVK